MQSRSARLGFDPMSIPGLSNKAREAVNAAFDSMSAWRNEIATTSESNSKKVFDKMATAAAALGWPEQIVDAARTQMQSIGEMQIATMDRIIDAWEGQLKLPNPTSASPSVMLSKLKSAPGIGATGDWPGADAFQMAATAPFALWMEFIKQWQKFWADSMTRASRG